MLRTASKGALLFLFGFLCAKGFDMAFQIEDLLRMLGGGGVELSNEKKFALRGLNLSANSTTSGALTIELEGAKVKIAELTKENTELKESLAKAQKIITTDAYAGSPSASNSKSGFSEIVQTAYDRALQPVVSTEARNKLDVNWWINDSGLTTQGGLGREDRILLGEIYGNASSVFEWGLGESTYMANYLGVERYAGIDSDPVWVGKARDKVAPHFRFYLADIGETKAWGYPTKRALQKNILNYQLSPLIVEPLPFDVYMIDGRWRLPSLIAAFLHASDRGAPHHKTIGLIHDCQKEANVERRTYKYADHLLTMVNHSNGVLCVYQRRPETTDEQLKDLWHQYMDNVER